MKFLSLMTALGLTAASAMGAEGDMKQEGGKDHFRILASPYEGEQSDVPSRVFRIKDDDVTMKLQAQSFPDSLHQIPGIYVQKTAPDRGTPIIRGFTTSRNVLIADGVRVNNPTLREGPNEYWGLLDPFAYTNVEVILGPGSVVYGSDAIGGVVLVSTKALPRGEAEQGLQWLGGDAYFRYGSAQDSFQEHVQMRLGYEDNLALSVGLTKGEFNNLHMGDSTALPNSDYENWGGFFRMEYDFDMHSTLVLGYDHYDIDNTNRVHRTPSSKSFAGTSVETGNSNQFRISDFDRRAAFARYMYRDGKGLIKEADFNISLQYITDDYRRIRDSDVNHSTRYWSDHTYGANLKLVSDSPIGELTYGFDYYFDKISSKGVNTSGAGVDTIRVQGSIADDAEYQQLGIYIQDKYAITNNLDIVGGLRYSWVELDANKVLTVGSLDNTWDEFTSSLHLVYRFNEEVNGYIGVSQGFRAPNLSDATRDDEFGSSGTEVPTANLDPEYFTTYETGLNVNTETYNFGLSLFYTQIRDLIVRQGSTGKDNLDGHLYGMELSGEYWFNKNWSVFGNISYVKTYVRNHIGQNINNDTIGDQMSKVPPLNGLAGIHWQPNDRFFAEIYAQMANDQDDLSQADRADTQRIPPGGTPGYVTYNARFGYKICENLDLGVTLENLSDEAYRIHGSGQNGAGRSILATLHYSF